VGKYRRRELEDLGVRSFATPSNARTLLMQRNRARLSAEMLRQVTSSVAAVVV
jgi:hypothetical protein